MSGTQIEEQIRQRQKMEAVGRLAGGVAHDFNNILTTIRGYAELILNDLQDPRLRDNVDQIIRAADRGAALTSQLLAFSRKKKQGLQTVSLNEVIGGLQGMLARLIGEDIELKISLDSTNGLIRAEPGQLEQIVMNLIINAREAMPQGGELILKTDDVFLEGGHLDANPSQGDRYVLLTVSDNGAGMDLETQSHIFEPFFTTKERGTGLGLATVYGIVKQYSGNIWVHSEVGKGTTFQVYLPRIEQNERREETLTDDVSLLGRETVLLVEDDEAVRSLLQSILVRHGYRVLEAKNGADAIEMCRRERDVDLLITDVIMPGISGRELAEKLLPIYPGVRLLYLSGYTEEMVVKNGVLPVGSPLLQKPFNPALLLRKLREILTQPLSPINGT